MKEIAKNQSVVVIVREKAHYGCSKLHYGDFDSPYLAMFVPAIKEEDGSYTDLRTGNMIELAKNDEAWGVFPGSVFEYPDGEQILISRKINPERTVITLSANEKEFTFRETSMCKHKAFYYKAPEKKPWEK